MNKAKDQYFTQIKSYLDDCYFDVATPMSGSKFIIDEAHLAKMITRIVVSAATIATTAISLKQYVKEIASHTRK